MSKTANRIVSLLLALVMALSCVTFVAADAKTVNQVAAEIETLSADANDYTAADKAAVEALKADYDALSADDQAALDSRTTHTGTGQPLGRVLESALWTVWSFAEADNSTTLADGTYNSTSTPALTSQYSKGKSTSSRQKAWSVKQVEVTDGKAYATIAVESDSYTAIMLHGKTYPKTSTTGNSEFANVPIDLNSTFYFNGVSSSMTVPIAFSLTTTIEEPAAEQPPEPPAVETFGFTLQVGQYTEGADFHTASFEDVTYSLTDQNNKTWQPSNATKGMLTYSNLPADGTYTFTAAKEDWAVVTQGEWDVAAHAYTYTFTGADAISVTITSADAGKNVTEATHPGMILRKKPREVNAVDEALAAVPTDLTIFTSATAAAVETAVAAADPEEKDEAKLSAMAAAVNGAVAALRPVDGSYTAVATHTGKGMFKIIDVLRLEVEGGEMTLHAVNGSKTYTKLYLGTTDEAKAADASAHILPVEEATASNNKAGYHWAIPVSALNTEIPVAAYSKSKSTFNSTGNFLVEAASLKRIAPPTVDLTITNNTGMFKAVTAQLETEGGNTTLVMALSGTGYQELFKGTYEQAVANGAATDNWIHGATNADGKWEFRIPLAEGETYVPVVAISNSYYTKYLNGQNSLARAFYPRQFTIDYEAKTIVTGDYAYSQTLEVANNVKMFSVSAATLDTVGGPNSNNYAATLTLTMGSTSFDKAFVGRASAITDTTETIALGEGITFVLPVKWVKEFGNPDTLESLLGGSFVVSFHSKKKDAWYERQFTVSEADGKLTIDEAPPEAVTVEPGTQTLEQGVCYRFGEGTFTLSGDPTVYQGGQEFYVSATGTYTVTKGR